MNTKNILVSSLITLFIITFNVFLLGGSSINNRIDLAYDLVGNNYINTPTDAWVTTWLWQQPPPGNYRILGKFPIIATYNIVKEYVTDHLMAFYYSFVLWAYLMLFITFSLFYKYVENLLSDLDKNIGTIACLLLAACPPILCAFKFPVHNSPNDFLGYALILAAFISLQHKNLIYFTLIMIISVFCRETNLIVLFVFFFFYTEYSWTKRFSISSLIMGVLVSYRLLWPGQYDPFVGSELNWTYPLESLIFLVMVFAVFWITAILGYLKIEKTPSLDQNLKIIAKSLPYVVILTVAVVFAFARIREFRIEFITFFTVLPLSIYYLNSIKANFQYLKNKWYLTYLVILFMGIGTLRIQLMPIDEDDYNHYIDLFHHWYRSFSGEWVSVTLIYLFITLALLPIMLLPLQKKET